MPLSMRMSDPSPAVKHQLTMAGPRLAFTPALAECLLPTGLNPIHHVSSLELLDRFDVRRTQPLQRELDSVQVSLIDRRPQRLGQL